MPGRAMPSRPRRRRHSADAHLHRVPAAPPGGGAPPHRGGRRPARGGSDARRARGMALRGSGVRRARGEAPGLRACPQDRCRSGRGSRLRRVLGRLIRLLPGRARQLHGSSAVGGSSRRAIAPPVRPRRAGVGPWSIVGLTRPPRRDIVPRAVHGSGPSKGLRHRLAIQDPRLRARTGARTHQQGDARPLRGARHRRQEPLVEHRGRAGGSRAAQGGTRGPRPRPAARRGTRARGVDAAQGGVHQEAASRRRSRDGCCARRSRGAGARRGPGGPRRT